MLNDKPQTIYGKGFAVIPKHCKRVRKRKNTLCMCVSSFRSVKSKYLRYLFFDLLKVVFC